MTTPLTTINARKYDGSIHRTWQAEMIDNRKELLILRGVFDSEINHPDLGLILEGTISHEYYWTSEWFNVFKFMNPDSTFRNFYCNINLPPKFDRSTIDFVDLDIDILVDNNLKTEILDRDDFEMNKSIYHYPDSVVLNVERTIRIVKHMIEAREFPFDQ